MLIDNYNKIRRDIDEACERVGRKPEEVLLVAVSKTKPLSDIEELAAAGVNDFGENKVQELCQKYDEVSRPVNFHQIGHLQTNKVKQVIGKACLIHSVDSFHLAEKIEAEAAKKDITVDVLLEVNVAEEESKFGLTTDNTEELVREISEKLPHVKIKGLMTIAPFVADPEENRPVFRKLHQLLLDIKSKNIDNVDMDVLSMGMTNDYVVAVEEGATIVRVGTAIFGERNYQI
ncbi:MAG: YggS family pyridoxal phosphate-dependent enzyme [Eubacterium sp.]|nr:YggS family pyridoxal phosphate-dependent enzyme [Eubacterium sp.]